MTAKPRRAFQLPSEEDSRMWEIWMGQLRFPALCVADDIGVFTFLDRGPATAAEVADGVGLGPRGAEALLALLASLGLLAQAGGRFELTATARAFLIPGAPYYWGKLLELAARMPITPEVLRETLEHDRAGGGYDLFDRHETDPAVAIAFTRAMHSQSFAAAAGVARAGDFAGVSRLLDVGGGSGALSIAIALLHPALRCTVLDIDSVCELARGYAEEWRVADRVDTVVVDMFREPWPDGYDAVLLSNVLHDWDQDQCLALLRSAHEALATGGRVYVHELLFDESRDGPEIAAAFSLVMIRLTAGKQFTAGELDELLREAGFDGVAVTPTQGYFSLVSARKA